MHTKTLLTTLVSALLISVSSMALAGDKKESEQPSQSMPGMGKMDMHHGMKGRGTKGEGMMGSGMMGGGMMEMMHGCKQMMGSGGMPELPAGNEKLQVQMHAEMMQKMGEILGRYADRIKDDKGSVH